MSFISVQYLSKGHNYCLGITPWKRGIFKDFLGRGHCKFVALARYLDAVRMAKEDGGRLICWASAVPEDLPEHAEAEGVELIRVEDGFIRSAGLGIKLALPGSLCFSRQGIHYDCTSPSDLETYLATTHFGVEERCIGQRLIRFIKQNKITKYNLRETGKSPKEWDFAGGTKKRVLVIGQVGDDASIKKGSIETASNEDLLKSVRAQYGHEEAAILYRPHPDVVSGLRAGKVDKAVTNELGIRVSSRHSILSLIEHADEVHVISSQAGLDALIMGTKVVCHGMPFYAGWGLTEDLHKINRRGRELSLAELIYAAFHAYPVYIDPFTRKEIDARQMITLISLAKTWPRAPRSFIAAVWLKRKKEKLKNWISNV